MYIVYQTLFIKHGRGIIKVEGIEGNETDCAREAPQRQGPEVE
jgi:hypothetical protein